METFEICFRMVCNGSVKIDAKSEEEAQVIFGDLSTTALADKCAELNVEVVSVNQKK